MVDLDIGQSTTTNLKGSVKDFSVDLATPDSITEYQKETYYDYPYASKHFGYYKNIPELKKAIDALAMWVGGKGYDSDGRTKAILENITGWGEDSFEAILNNLIVQKKVFGDAYAEIVRDGSRIVNIKPLFTGDMRVVVNSQGLITRYEQRTRTARGKPITFTPPEILHLVNDRVANEIHGTGVIESVQWVIDARNEAMRDLRQMLHRMKAIGVLEVDTEDATKISSITTQYENMIKNGEVLVFPKGAAEIKDATLTNIKIQELIGWIKYLENFFYQAVGIPKVILGGSEEFTEASSKIGYLTFEQVYSKEQRELESDLWNQLALRITFNKPASLKNELLNSEQKNTGQVGFQPNETTAAVGRTE